jgi:phage terminase small subunit
LPGDWRSDYHSGSSYKPDRARVYIMATRKKNKPLPPKRQKFVDRYCVHFNATRAAREAGYSEANAGTIGYQLRQKAPVKEAIQKRMATDAMDATEVLTRLSSIARGDVLDIFDVMPDGSFKLNLQKAIDEGKTHLIHSMEWDRNGLPKVKLHDAHTALRDLGKAAGVFVDRQEVSGPGGAPFKVETEFAGMSRSDLLKLRAKLLEPTEGEGED